MRCRRLRQAEELGPAMVGPPKAYGDVGILVSQYLGSSHSDISSHSDSQLWDSSSGVLPLFASETSICISMNVIIMTQGKVTQEATFKHIILAQSSI